MSHLQRNPAKLLARVRRIGGQVSALEAALVEGAECAAVLTQIAAVRGAVHGLMLEVLNDHLKEHVAGESSRTLREQEVDIVTGLMRTYLK